MHIGKLFSLFLIQNICCGDLKDPSQWDGFETVLLSTQDTFWLMGKKIFTILPNKISFIWICENWLIFFIINIDYCLKCITARHGMFSLCFIYWQGRSGEIMHLYRSFAFLLSRMMTENGGYFVCKTRHLVQAGGSKVSQGFYHRGT